MSAEEVRQWVDMLIALMAPASLGGIILAAIGYWRAKQERPAHIAHEPPGGAGVLAQIGGMVMGRQMGEDIIEALNSIASAQDRCTLVREKEIRVAQELSETRHREMRILNDNLDRLCDRLKSVVGLGA